MSKGHTIQDVIDSGDSLTAYCHNPLCNHSARLDMIKLRDKYGPDHGAMHDDLVPKLYCAKCSGKKVGLIYSPAVNNKTPTSPFHNMYAKSKGS